MSGRSPETADINLATGEKTSIRKVEFSRTPEIQPYAERARELGNEVYPKIVALLSDGSAGSPEQVDVRFKKRFSIFFRYDHTGKERLGFVTARSKTVYINTTLLADLIKSSGRNLPQDDFLLFDKVFNHELVHVAQHYPSSTFRNHRHWAEGIPDYVRYKLGDTNGWRCAECSAEFPHYTSGYTCAGAFLLYVDELHGADVIRQMNTELRHGTYSDDFFVRATGKSLDELWTGFQARPEFKPIAAQLYELQKALGYVNAKPPRRVEAQFKKHMAKHPQAAAINRSFEHITFTYGSKQFSAFAQNQTRSPRATTDHNLARTTQQFARIPINLRMQLFLYIAQPGGSAESFFVNLRKQELPGDFNEGDTVTSSFSLNLNEVNSGSYSNSRTFVLKKNSDPSNYNYTVARDSKGADWKLQKAWRSSADGQVVEEFEITK
ncbi:MAG: hypothetical protein H0X66_14750 [Verrucomicrobia bacterium]|nr:hypothetical protein [Verrucomicrobiota bacterium]